MEDHVCTLKSTSESPLTFECDDCDVTHKCGMDDCDSIFYNSDHTHVCTLTGMCFNQRICETFTDSSRAYGVSDPVYVKRAKRDQQIKNKVLDRRHTMKIIKCAATIVELSDEQHDKLCGMIMSLWTKFVHHISSKNQYVHRKDKRCFVVAITMSLENGIKNNMGQFIVSPHGAIRREKLNKKSKYDEFDVSDIRYGQNLIKKVFNGVEIDHDTLVRIQ